MKLAPEGEEVNTTGIALHEVMAIAERVVEVSMKRGELADELAVATVLAGP